MTKTSTIYMKCVQEEGQQSAVAAVQGLPPPYQCIPGYQDLWGDDVAADAPYGTDRDRVDAFRLDRIIDTHQSS